MKKGEWILLELYFHCLAVINKISIRIMPGSQHISEIHNKYNTSRRSIPTVATTTSTFYVAAWSYPHFAPLQTFHYTPAVYNMPLFDMAVVYVHCVLTCVLPFACFA